LYSDEDLPRLAGVYSSSVQFCFQHNLQFQLPAKKDSGKDRMIYVRFFFGRVVGVKHLQHLGSDNSSANHFK